MNVNTYATDLGLGVMLATATGFATGLGETPEAGTFPFYIVYPQASAELSGSFGNPNDMGDMVYQITCVGQIYAQAVSAEERAIAALCNSWQDVPGCMGVPLVARRGTLRLEDNLWQAILVTTLKVSAA